MPTGRSSADVVGTGPARSLALLLGLRARGLRTPARVAVVVGVALLVAVTVVAVTFPSQVGLAPELVEAMRRYLPVGFLAFVVTTATAVLFGGGGREAIAADQVVTYPLGPTTDHLAGLVLAPLNLAWLLQACSCWPPSRCSPRAATPGPPSCPSCCGLVAVTVAVQWLSWVVEYVRRGPHGELVVRTTAVLVGLTIVVVVATGHLLDAALWTPAAWASSPPAMGAAGDWLNWLFGCLLLTAAALGMAILGVGAARVTWTRPATTQARVETRRYAMRAFPRSDLRGWSRSTAPACGGPHRCAGGGPAQPVARRGRLRRPAGLADGAGPAGPRRLGWRAPVRCERVGARRAGRGLAESLPVAPRTVLVARAWVLVEVLTVASVATLLICGWRAGAPTSAELSAALCATVTIALRTVASGLRWSVRRPFSVDLRSVRATPAPPLVMVGYSARLAVAATLTGLLFSVVGRLFPWWYSVVVAVVLCATSVFSLWWTGRLWERPSVRSRVVETVASV